MLDQALACADGMQAGMSPRGLTFYATINSDSERPYIPDVPTPLYAPPLAEADTWPYVPRYPVDRAGFGTRAPRRVYLTPAPLPVAPVPVRAARRRHSWLYWRVRAIGYAVVDLWGEMRLCGGWLGEVAFLCVLAASGAAAVVSALLVYFWLAGR